MCQKYIKKEKRTKVLSGPYEHISGVRKEPFVDIFWIGFKAEFEKGTFSGTDEVFINESLLKCNISSN